MSSTYNPRDYADVQERIRAWVTAGRPNTDMFGNTLDNRGDLIEFGFGAPDWAVQPQVNNPTGPNSFLYQFAQNRPWAQRYLSAGGSDMLRYQLNTITPDDFSRYSPDDQQLILQILNGSRPDIGPRPPGSLGPNATARVAPPRQPVGSVPGAYRPGTNPNPDPVIPGGGQARTNGQPYLPYGESKNPYPLLKGSGLNGLSQNMGNNSATGRSPFSLGSFKRSSPRGYQGY